jgi:hypothetical protein
MLQLARLIKGSTDFDERRLSGAVFLDLLKASGTVWHKGLFYGLTVLNFPSYLGCRTFHVLRRVMRAGVAECGLTCPVLSCLYVSYIPTPHHGEVPQYADGMAVLATSRDSSFLIGYLEACLGRLEL